MNQNIKVKNLSSPALNEIDKISRKRGTSRQQFLKSHFETFFQENFVLDIESNFEKLSKELNCVSKKSIELIKFNNELIQQVKKEILKNG